MLISVILYIFGLNQNKFMIKFQTLSMDQRIESTNVYINRKLTDGAVFYDGDICGSFKIIHGEAIVPEDSHMALLQKISLVSEKYNVEKLVIKDKDDNIIDKVPVDEWHKLKKHVNP